MNIVLWVIQILLALAFFMAGFLKASQPLEKLSKNMEWVTQYPPAFTRFIGVAEILGALGLILPPLIRIFSWVPLLTIAAAIGLAIIMVCAFVLHLSKKEYKGLLPVFILFLLAAFVVYGRLALSAF